MGAPGDDAGLSGGVLDPGAAGQSAMASTPPPIVVRRTAAHLLRHAILLDFQCAFASDSGGAKPSKWRPRTAAAFATRWAKLCTRVNGLPDFHELIGAPRDTSP